MSSEYRNRFTIPECIRKIGRRVFADESLTARLLGPCQTELQRGWCTPNQVPDVHTNSIKVPDNGLPHAIRTMAIVELRCIQIDASGILSGCDGHGHVGVNDRHNRHRLAGDRRLQKSGRILPSSHCRLLIRSAKTNDNASASIG